VGDGNQIENIKIKKKWKIKKREKFSLFFLQQH